MSAPDWPDFHIEPVDTDPERETLAYRATTNINGRRATCQVIVNDEIRRRFSTLIESGKEPSF